MKRHTLNNVLHPVWLQKLFTGKDLEDLKQTARTQCGQVCITTEA